jgi:signal transduction histidine kinase
MNENQIKFIDIVKNIWYKKIYIFVIVVLILFITTSHVLLHKYVFERFSDTMMDFIVEESEKVGKHIAVHQDVTKKNEIMQIALGHIMVDFNIAKIKLFDKDGYVIYSTVQKDIGEKNKHDYFYNNVQKGNIFYKVVNKGETTLENHIIQKDVAEIYIPIMKDGVFLGASEIYYDISEKKYYLDQVIEQTDRLFIIVLLALTIIVLMMIYFASKNDILKQIQENTSKELESILQKQKRTTALGELIGNIAHHWRQPLSLITTAITGYKLRNDLNIATEDELEKTTDLIVRSANNLSETINRFRDFVVNVNEKKEFFINNAIENVLENSKDLLENNQIEVKADLETIKINGYEKELQDVILNLIINSNEAFARNNVEHRSIEIALKSVNNMVNIIIKDNAGGIEDGVINKIFDPYFTTKHQYQGTGLGLFFCLKIVKDYFGGTIDCENQDEINGVIFTIAFPLNKD